MDMKTFIKTSAKEELEIVASKAGTTVAYFNQLAGKHRMPSPSLAKRLEKASKGKLTRQELLPEVYGE